MKVINKTALASTFVMAFAVSAYAVDEMTLNDVITRTLDTHPEYLEADKKVESARQKIIQAKAGYLPSVDLTLGTGYERTENQTTLARQQANSYRSGDNDLNRQEATLSVTQMLFDGFATPARVDRARAEFENQVSYTKEIAEKVTVAAAQSFYDVLREEENLEISKENLRMHKNYQSQIQKRVRSGKSNRADLEQVISRVALAESQVIQREELVEQAKSEFFRQVGVEAENLIAPAVDYALVPATLDEAIEIAYYNSPRIQSLTYALKASKQTVKEAKSAYMPTVNLEAQINRNQNVSGTDKKDQSEQLMLRMRYNLFNGGADRANHMASLSDKEAAEKALEDTKRQVERDVRTAWYEYQLTSKRIPSLNEQVRSAKATKIAYKSQFDVGKRTLLDVLDSEREYNSARQTLITATLSRDFAVYELLGTMGKATENFVADEEVILELEEANDLTTVEEVSPELTEEMQADIEAMKEMMEAENAKEESAVIINTESFTAEGENR